MLAISVFILASSAKSNLEEFINMLQTDKLLRQMLILYNSSKYQNLYLECSIYNRILLSSSVLQVQMLSNVQMGDEADMLFWSQVSII